MPGRLHTNYRRGNLSESLGLLLLQSLAAVADVPRTEDVGIDAVCTLLRRDSDGNSYAEDTFVVQLKSESPRPIAYRDHELSWLLGQSQPMFIGLVSRDTAGISLYPTVYVNHAVLSLHAESVTIHCSKHEGSPFPWAGSAVDHSAAAVWLGPPLLSWTIADTEAEAWLDSAYAVMKQFLEVLQREQILLSFRQTSLLVWATNDKGSIQPSPGLMMAHPDDLHKIIYESMPGLKALLMQAVASPQDPRRRSLGSALLGVLARLADLGLDLDPSVGMLAQLLLSARKPDDLRIETG